MKRLISLSIAAVAGSAFGMDDQNLHTLRVERGLTEYLRKSKLQCDRCAGDVRFRNRQEMLAHFSSQHVLSHNTPVRRKLPMIKSKTLKLLLR